MEIIVGHVAALRVTSKAARTRTRRSTESGEPGLKGFPSNPEPLKAFPGCLRRFG